MAVSGEAGVIEAPETPEASTAGDDGEGAGRTDDTLLPTRRQRRVNTAFLVTLATVVVVILALAGAVAWTRGHDSAAPAQPVVLGPLLALDPPADAQGVRPEAKVTVHANRGRLSAVHVVDAAGHELAGATDPLSGSWVSSGRLALDTTYRVTTRVVGVGKHAVVRTSSFSTVHPAGYLDPTITPDKETVGIGAPIVIRFKNPVANRDIVSQGLAVSMSQPVDGAWHWFSSREVHYRPKDYWPVGEHVTLTASLAQVDAGNNIWGEGNHSVSFTIGDSHITTVDTDAHTMTVAVNGTVVRNVPQSSGREKYPTMGGVHVVLDKAQHVVMDSATVGIPVNSPDGYREDVYWNVAITNGGEYVHAAPWSMGAQGNRNVSHGCVNISPTDAKWFYSFSQVGDIVRVLGSGRPPSSSDAGTADWNMTWDQWLQPTA